MQQLNCAACDKPALLVEGDTSPGALIQLKSLKRLDGTAFSSPPETYRCRHCDSRLHFSNAYLTEVTDHE